MKKLLCMLSLSAFAGMAGASSIAAAQASACPPPGIDKAGLQALQKNEFALPAGEKAAAWAHKLLPCLQHPDPQLRDDYAFSALYTWLRKGQIKGDEVAALRRQLWQLLAKHKDDKDALQTSFLVLSLAEVSRVDRLLPFLSKEERAEQVRVAADYLQQVRDYRGFDEQQGWRHAVAHGADWVLQIALHPQLENAQRLQLLTAISGQVTPANHSYQYGEGERLARAAYYLIAKMEAEQIQTWLRQLLAQWKAQAPNFSQGKLHLRHNLNSFLLPLYFMVQEGGNADLKQKLLPLLVPALKELG